MKGAPTFTLDTEGTCYINSSGNSGLATAGSGDVLAGILAGLLVQMRNDPCSASIAATFLHGYAGDLVAKAKTKMGMTATDVIEMLPYAFKELGVQ
jgi:NAD(P)H-hydrate epimerase